MLLAAEIQKVNETALFILHKSALIDPHFAQALLGTHPEVSKLFAEISAQQLHRLSRLTLPLVTLRDGQNVGFWKALTHTLTEQSDAHVRTAYASAFLKLADTPGLAATAAILSRTPPAAP